MVTAGKQIARLQIAPIHGVMRQLFALPPVEVLELVRRDHLRFSALSQSVATLRVDIEGEIVRAVSNNQAAAAPARAAGLRKGSQRIKLTTHGEIEVQKFLAKNGPSGWYSPSECPRAPVVHRTIQKLILARSMGMGSPSVLPGPDEKRRLQFESKLRESDKQSGSIRWFDLTTRAGAPPVPLISD